MGAPGTIALAAVDATTIGGGVFDEADDSLKQGFGAVSTSCGGVGRALGGRATRR